MDAVTRQVGKHIEFEPEWEGAFNVQLKLSDTLALLQIWCSNDVSFVNSMFAVVLLILCSPTENYFCVSSDFSMQCHNFYNLLRLF